MKYTVKVGIDTDPLNPRENYDNLATMVCRHRRYTLGDADAEDILDVFEDGYYFNGNEALKKGVVALPLFLYDHSGITMSTTPFHCPWDSGVVGYIYVTFDKMREEFGWKRMTPKRIERTKELLRNEVHTYDQYITGEVYFWRIQDEDETTVEACYGYFDKEDAVSDCTAQLVSLL